VQDRLRPLMGEDDDEEEKEKEKEEEDENKEAMIKKQKRTKRNERRKKRERRNRRKRTDSSYKTSSDISKTVANNIWKFVLQRVQLFLTFNSPQHDSSMVLMDVLSSVIDCVPWKRRQDSKQGDTTAVSDDQHTSDASNESAFQLLTQVKADTVQRLMQNNDTSTTNLLLLLCAHLHAVLAKTESGILSVDDVIHKHILQFRTLNHSVGVGLTSMTTYSLCQSSNLWMSNTSVEEILEIATLGVFDAVKDEGSSSEVARLRIAAANLLRVVAERCHIGGHILRRSVCLIQCLQRLCTASTKQTSLNNLHATGSFSVNAFQTRHSMDALSSLLPWIELETDRDINILFTLLSQENHMLVKFRACFALSSWLSSWLIGKGSRKEQTRLPSPVQAYIDQHLYSATKKDESQNEFKGNDVSSLRPMTCTSSTVVCMMMLCDVIVHTTATSDAALPALNSNLLQITKIAERWAGPILEHCFRELRVIGSDRIDRTRIPSNIDRIVKKSLQHPMSTLSKTSSFMDVPASTVLYAHAIFVVSISFPTCLRQWYHRLPRNDGAIVSLYFAKFITPAIIMEEKRKLKKEEEEEMMEKEEMATKNKAPKSATRQPILVPRNPFENDDDVEDDNLSIHYDSSAREFIAIYNKGEVTLEIGIVLPIMWPMKTVKVTCRKRIGVKENQWRRWSLQIHQLLSNCDGTIMDGIRLWKRNVDREFEGVEECSICYSVVHVVDQSLPKMLCHTCHQTFHSSCLFKWFSKANKSTCPLCRSDM